jgi:hypothetical protein
VKLIASKKLHSNASIGQLRAKGLKGFLICGGRRADYQLLPEITQDVGMKAKGLPVGHALITLVRTYSISVMHDLIWPSGHPDENASGLAPLDPLESLYGVRDLSPSSEV